MKEELRQKREMRNRHESPGFPLCQLFEVHGSKLKPHPVGNLGQTSIMRITHPMLFFGVGKNTLNGFFAPCVKIPVFRSVSGIVGQLLIVFPDVP